MSKLIFSRLRSCHEQAQRHFGMGSDSDPIQKIFMQKVQEYKSKSSGGKLVDVTPEIQQEMKNELDRVAKQYGGGEGIDMTKFPEFKFDEPTIDPISPPKMKLKKKIDEASDAPKPK